MPKVLVNISEPNGDDNWGKYPLNAAQEIEIRPGRGDWCETPKYDTRAERRTCGLGVGPFRVLRKKYVLYNRMSKKLVLRNDSEYPAIDWNFINKLLKGKALAAYTDEQKPGMTTYISIILLVILVFYIVVLPNV